MNLIKIGNRYINLDNVYQISFNDEGRRNNPEAKVLATLDILVADSIYEETGSPVNPVREYFHQQEAEALRYYLDGEAPDVMNIYERKVYDTVTVVPI
jgi:hypothetical protein